MPAAGMAEIVGPAVAGGRGVGAFNIIGIEHAEAVIAGAEAAGAPVVLAISQNCVAYHGALEPIARAALALAGSAAVPVAVHLDHATGDDLVRAAVAVGVGSVMYDASGAPHAQNVAATAAVTRWCHERRRVTIVGHSRLDPRVAVVVSIVIHQQAQPRRSTDLDQGKRLRKLRQ